MILQVRSKSFFEAVYLDPRVFFGMCQLSIMSLVMGFERRHFAGECGLPVGEMLTKCVWVLTIPSVPYVRGGSRTHYNLAHLRLALFP